MDLITVPFDETLRTYEVQARAIADGYNDSKESDPVWSTIAGKFKPEFRMTGQDFYDIAATNYEHLTQYGRWDYRDSHRLAVGENYTYAIVGTELYENLNYKWSVVDDGILTNAGSINGASTPSVSLQFADLSGNGTIKNAPGTKLSATLTCEVKIGDGTLYTGTYTKVISVGDYDVCSWGIGLEDSEENEYTVSRFGEVCWMTQNLRSTKTIQTGTEMELIEDANADNTYNTLYYYYPNKSKTTFEANRHYGLLYTWAAANVGSPAESNEAFPNQASTRQGICPEGWVIPSDWDWSNLEKEIATKPDLYSAQDEPFPQADSYDFHTTSGWRPDDGKTETSWGRQMRSPTAVTTANPAGSSNTDGSGFNALLVGDLFTNTVYNYGTQTEFWSSSTVSSAQAWVRSLNNSSSGSYRGTYSGAGKNRLFSVRCKKLE
jgi:uncharacterized protein (TIGR02145 family)